MKHTHHRKNTIDHNLRKSGGKDAETNRRREEAIARNLIWQKKTLEEKIEILLGRPGNCTKQLAKLSK